MAYAIAPGWDAVGDLVVVHSIVVSSVPFYRIQGVGTYDPGDARFKVSGAVDDEGYAALTWQSHLTWAHYEYIINTILLGKRSGKVTINTRLTGATYYNRNAWLTMPKTSELTRVYGIYPDVQWRFTRVHAVSA